MDIYILDEDLNDSIIYDKYTSFVWTERFSSAGDFEIEADDTVENRALLTEGTKLSIRASQRVMIIDTVEMNTSDENARTLKITGMSLEAELSNRSAMNSLGPLDGNEKWTLTGLPQDIMTNMFLHVCHDPMLDPNDGFPNFQTGSLNPQGNLDLPDAEFSVDISPGDGGLLGPIKQMAEEFGLGFRLVRGGPTGNNLYFEVYVGNDRTSSQNQFNPVVFGESLETFSNVTHISSIATYKNIAYVRSVYGSRVVYDSTTDSTAEGFGRRVLTVIADDITLSPGPSLDAALERRGLQALAANRSINSFDGEIPQNVSFVYGVDYGLGDLVETRTSDGKINNMYVVEQIFTSDENGDRSYPTMEYSRSIMPESWSSYKGNVPWESRTTETWETY